MGMGSVTGKATVSDAQKMSQVPKKVSPKFEKYLSGGFKKYSGTIKKIAIDKNANPRELKKS